MDLTLDAVGGGYTASALATVKRGGKLLTTAGQVDQGQAQAAGVQAEFFNAQLNSTADLLTNVAHMIDAGQLQTAIAATFALADANKANEMSQGGHGRGRIILHVA